MFRLLLLCIAFFALYIGFTYVNSYDTQINFVFSDYQVETTLFTFAVTILVGVLLLLMVLKFLFLLFDLPQIIKNKMHSNRLHRLNSKLLRAIAEMIIGNKITALELASRVAIENDDDNEDVLSVINAEKEIIFEEKIKYLRVLIDKRHYRFFASKKLAEAFYSRSHYAEAEEYAVKAFNINDTDTGIMLLLIRIYAKMGLWSKMVFLVSKIQRADVGLLESISTEIAEYYFRAAQSVLASEDDVEAARYLESALELRVDYPEALILYSEIKIGMKHTAEALKVLKIAYSFNPTFQIAELFIESSTGSAEVKYGALASLVDPKDHKGLYLAIAAYLDLPERINELQKLRLLTQDAAH